VVRCCQNSVVRYVNWKAGTFHVLTKGCKCKTGCKGRCGCRRVGRKCGPSCYCIDCQNTSDNNSNTNLRIDEEVVTNDDDDDNDASDTDDNGNNDDDDYDDVHNNDTNTDDNIEEMDIDRYYEQLELEVDEIMIDIFGEI
jgi:hypothetical protein